MTGTEANAASMVQLDNARMGYSVLVVDLQPLVLARLVEPLRAAGYEVIAASSFEAAKERIASSPPIS